METIPDAGPADATESQVVLIVDDSADARGVIHLMATDLGVNIIEAANGRQALSIVKRQKVDVILSDLLMPRMSGLMLLHTLLEQGYHMPFVVITGYSDKDSAIQALRLGAFDYLEKPLHESELLPVLQEALKVSREQHSLLSVSHLESAQHPDANVDRNAEIQIMKMRTFRFKGDACDFAVGNGIGGSWHDLKALFLQEAEHQLHFSAGALNTLLASESRAVDLGFVLRVIQSVRIASESVHLSVISGFAWEMETNLAALKHVPEQLSSARIELLLDANRALLQMVMLLANPELRDTMSKLAQSTDELQAHKRAG